MTSTENLQELIAFKIKNTHMQENTETDLQVK